MERWTGRDPSSPELSERSSRRQIPTSTLPLSHSSKPPKAFKKFEISWFAKR